MVAVAIGINGDPAAKAEGRRSTHGVDVLVIDTAHGHQDARLIQAVRERPQGRRRDTPIVAGNVVTARGTA